MNSSAKRGNDPERWEKLLADLDEKLQLGLLDRLKRVTSYHFESDVLYIESGDKSDQEYLTKETNYQHLKLMAEDCIRVDNVKIKKIF